MPHPDPILDGLVCPISGILMRDPAMTADGHSYERRYIEQWFGGGNRTSPLTGKKLPSTVLLPNHNLKKAVEDLLRRHPNLRGGVPPSPTKSRPKTERPWDYRSWAGASELRSPDIEVFGDVARRTAPHSSWHDCIIFVEGELCQFQSDLPTFTAEVVETTNAVGGLSIGIVTRNPRGWGGSLQDLVDNYGTFIDGGGWVRANASQLMTKSSWNPGQLREGDQITFQVDRTGLLQLEVNRLNVVRSKTDLQYTNDQNFWGFVALGGNAQAVRLLARVSL